MSTGDGGRVRKVDRVFRSAVADLLAGRLTTSIEKLDRCLALDSTHAPAWATRAGVHLREGRYAEAASDIARAIELRPGNIGDLNNRAIIWMALGRYRRAIRDYEDVLLEEPGSAGTRNNLAWLLATARDPRVRDGTRAVAYAAEAIALSRQPAWLDTLAAAHAECGDFDRAIVAEEEAYRRSDPPNEGFRRRLAGYCRGQTILEQRETHDAARS
jgi:tetratricopeptide (TPR) repeat protein